MSWESSVFRAPWSTTSRSLNGLGVGKDPLATQPRMGDGRWKKSIAALSGYCREITERELAESSTDWRMNVANDAGVRES